MVDSKVKRVQALFEGYPIQIEDNGYPYVFLPLTDFIEPISAELIEDMADLIISKMKSFDIDVVVSESDRGGGPLAQAVAKKLRKPFILANWYAQKMSQGIRSHAKVGFSGEGFIYLMGLKKNQKVLIVDDIISSGGTLISLIESVFKIGASISDVICVGEKVDQNGVVRVQRECNVFVKSLIKFSAKGSKTTLVSEADSFWDSKSSEQYENFNITLPSEIVAYDLVYYLANLKNKTVLDFGCYNGNSTSKILSCGAKDVIGVDCSLDSINVAKKNHKLIQFFHVPKKSSLLFDSVFDVCTMTFVHPVIEDQFELLFSFKEIHKVLQKDGSLLLLGLNPMAFNKKFKFNSYDFNVLPENEWLDDGHLFSNNLYLPDKSVLPLKDVFWKSSTLSSLLRKTGFSDVSVINVDEKDLPFAALPFFKKLLQSISKKFNKDWKDEWTAPLYQIIIAKK